MGNILLSLLLLFSISSCHESQAVENKSITTKKKTEEKEMTYPITKSEEEWEKILTPFQYHVLREKGTEVAFSGEYHNHKEKGIYHCAACNNPLFSSEHKYDSGTGWPSFWQPIQPSTVKEIKDNSHGMIRVEVVCSQCGSHQGHVFEDGPKPTGLRYCINSVSLRFSKSE